MKNLKHLIFYLAIIGGFGFLMYQVVIWGQQLEVGKLIPAVPLEGTAWDHFSDTYQKNLGKTQTIVLMQIITIILAVMFFGYICKKLGQPRVIGEILAGIVLGPSIMGAYLPDVSAFLFPAKSIDNLRFLSNMGLILFMFIVGMEVDVKILKNKAREAMVISHASIIIPFSLGMGLAYFIYAHLAPNNISFLSFSLFIGIAMSITAFPVLARIVQERGMAKTRLGTIVITCSAVDDITAWCILAAVIAIVEAGSFGSAIYTIAIALAYILVMIYLVRPLLRIVEKRFTAKQELSRTAVAICFLVLLISAYVTRSIGIHMLFGAFMMGVIMPPSMKLRALFIEKVQDVALVMLLPLFFVLTGLRTQIGLLNEPWLWQICGLIILVAVIGKFAGSALAARFVGQSWKDSLLIGALMNTRGLMEIVVLNIGYDLGILTPEVFAMMVIMAVATTFMTGPAIDVINWIFRKKSKTEEDPVPEESMAA